MLVLLHPFRVHDGVRLSRQQNRLQSKRRKRRLKWKLAAALVQAAYLLWKTTDNGHYLLECLSPFITETAEYQAEREWSGLRRTGAPDFESELWYATWKVLEKYDVMSGYTLWETLRLAWRRRVLNVPYRATKTGNGKLWEESESFEQLFEEKKLESESDFQNPGNDVQTVTMYRILVQQLIAQPCLTAQEQNLLAVMLAYPQESLQAYAKAIGRKHHQEVTRLIQSVAKKLPYFNPFSDAA